MESFKEYLKRLEENEEQPLTEAEIKHEIEDRISQLVFDEISKLISNPKEAEEKALELSQKIYQKIIGTILQNFRQPKAATIN